MGNDTTDLCFECLGEATGCPACKGNPFPEHYYVPEEPRTAAPARREQSEGQLPLFT